MASLRDRFTCPAIETLFANSRLTNRALIIVEGVDDIQFYSRIADVIGKSFKFQAIENIEGYSEGCDEVIRAARDFQGKLSEQEINQRFFLAIIDNDVRQFRGEELNLNGLFRLKYYSFESHYLTASNLKKLILDLTQTEHDLLDDDFLQTLTTEISNEISEALYLPSLEALKNALNTGYNNLVGYSTTAGEILNNQELINQIKQKEGDLELLANELGLVKNYETVRNIAKGKWILSSYSKQANKKIKALKDMCSLGDISKCQFCNSGQEEKCLYKMQHRPQEGQLIEMIKNLIDQNELGYIINKLKELN